MMKRQTITKRICAYDDCENIECLKSKLRQTETERDNWEKWCMGAEEDASYLRGKLDNIRQEADIRQPVKGEGE